MGEGVRPPVIGVTGPAGAGKSLVAGMVAELLGGEVVDVDEVGHKALDVCRGEVVRIFGEGVVREGRVDRRVLGRVVFADREARERLERVVHPWMREEVMRRVEGRRGPVVVDAALLGRMGLDAVCDRVVVVRAPWWVRVWRLVRRDGRSVREAVRILRAQHALFSQPFSCGVDTEYVSNVGSKRHLRDKIATLLVRWGYLREGVS